MDVSDWTFLECVHLLLSDYLVGVCQEMFYNTQGSIANVCFLGKEVAFWNAGFIRYSSLAWLLAVGSGTTDPEAKPISISFPLSLLFIAATADPQTTVS